MFVGAGKRPEGRRWEKLAEHYGLDAARSFEVRWLPTWNIFRRYDFTLMGTAPGAALES